MAFSSNLISFVGANQTSTPMAKKEKITELFDNIAPEYDHLNHLLSLNIDTLWRRRAAREIVNSATPLSVLDVACGTGDFTIEVARRLPEGSSVVGIDLSEGMMAVGRKKIAAAGVEATLEVGDCENLPYTDGSFDRVSAAFGVRNFEHIDLGIKEMCRVLKSGGKLVILELSIPTNRLIRWCYKVYFLNILPAIGGRISGNRGAYKYLPASVLHFPAPDRFVQMMHEAGFPEVSHKAFTFDICRMYVGIK